MLTAADHYSVVTNSAHVQYIKNQSHNGNCFVSYTSKHNLCTVSVETKV